MANYIAQCITPRVSSDHIAKITVPAGGLKAGQVVIADTLDAAITGNYEVFTATQPTEDKLSSKSVGIVLNDGFETMSDGRRPNGQPNYYQYTYNEGETAPIIYLDSHLVFIISKDALDSRTASEAAVGKFLYPTNGSNNLTVGDAIPSGTTMGLKVVALYNTPIGGLPFNGFAPSFVCIAQ